MATQAGHRPDRRHRQRQEPGGRRVRRSAAAQVIAGDQLGHEALRQPDDPTRRSSARWGDGRAGRAGRDRPPQARRHRVRRPGRAAGPGGAGVSRGSSGAFAEEVDGRPRPTRRAASSCWTRPSCWRPAGTSVCDRIVYVDAPREVRLQRAGASSAAGRRRRWKPAKQAQMPLTEKAARADHVVDNSGLPRTPATGRSMTCCTAGGWLTPAAGRRS